MLAKGIPNAELLKRVLSKGLNYALLLTDVTKSVPINVILITILCLSSVRAQVANQPPASSRAPTTTADWTVLDQRQGRGEQCLVCGHPIIDKDVVEVRYKGRRFFVAAGDMLRFFSADPDRYFAKMQANSALFDERTIASKPMSLGWLGLGLYVLFGLITGAACGYIAVTKGMPPVPWLLAALVGNAVVLAIILNAPSRKATHAPEGVPSGLCKVPSTHWPIACRQCGNQNHPSATACTGCGAQLDPTVQSETKRL